MPATPRDSSVLSLTGARRPTARAHVPFRQNEHVQGKRTGLKAKYVDPDSDGIEPFEAILGQLDNVPQPTVRGKPKPQPRATPRHSNATPRRSMRSPILEEDEDEEHEEYDVTMDIDPSPPPSRKSVQAPGTPKVTKRGPPPRSVPRLSDYDRIPSPSRVAPPRARARTRPSSVHDDYDIPMASSSGGRPRPRASAGGRGGTPYARAGGDDDENPYDSPGVSRRAHPRASRGSIARAGEMNASRARPSDIPTPRPSFAPGDFGTADTSLGGGAYDEEPSVRSSFAQLSDAAYDDSSMDEPDHFPEEFHEHYPPDIAEERAPSVQASARAGKKDKGKARTRPPPVEVDEEEEDRRVEQQLDVPKSKARARPPPIDEEEEVEDRQLEEHLDVPMEDYPPPNEQDDYDEPLGGPQEPEDVPMEPLEDEQEEEVVAPKAKTKAKAAKEKKTKRKAPDDVDENGDPVTEGKKTAKKARSRSAKAAVPEPSHRRMSVDINQHPSDDEGSSADERGLRRGKRKRYRPLDWWRLEKVEYGRGKALAEIKRIITLPKEPVQPLGAKKRVTKRAKSKPAEAAAAGKKGFNPEEGWDAKTEPEGVVQDWVTRVDIRRRVVWPARLVNPRPAENNSFQFQKIFGDGDFIAAGQLVIPPNKSKPSKNSKDNSYVFYIIEGAVKFTVHNTAYVACQGAMVLVPRGNAYSIHNISDRPVRVFFAQARKIRLDEDEDPPAVVSRRSRTSGASDASSGGGSVSRRASTAARA